MLDIVYLACNRLEFTRETFSHLIENTDWRLVDGQLIVYDDGSTDGTLEYLREQTKLVRGELRETRFGSPVSVMNHYVDRAGLNAWFAKIDNDIMVPPGWLNEMLGVLNRNPELELLGMEGGRTGRHLDPSVQRGVELCSHIGGVGLIKTEVIGARRRMVANGRFGWTEHQHEFEPVRGWIAPDLQVFSLDQVPFEPWQTYAAEYVDREWARPWPDYFDRWMSWYWEWWHDEADG